MKKLPFVLALALLGACTNPTTTADDTDKGAATTQDRAGAAPSGDSTAATSVTGGTDGRMTDGGTGATSADQTPAEDPMQPGASVTDDANFINSALADGQFEIQASNRILKESKDANLKAFAQQMITDHTKAGDELRQIAAGQKMNVTDRLSMEQQKMLGQLEKETGATLQKSYVDAVTKGHETAVALFRNASTGAKRPELQAFAKKYLPTIEHHAMMAKDLQAGKAMKM